MNTATNVAQEPQARYQLELPADASITNRIHVIRGQRVMLDRDLAALYGVETKQLKRQVRRNSGRFPEDFMFELSAEEHENLRSQFGTSSWGGTRYAPMAFTEQGVAMLSSVLNSEQAILVNIQIIRVFTRMREVMLTNQEVLRQLEQLEHRVSGHDVDVASIMRALRQLMERPAEPRKSIGYKADSN
ncbi:MAG: ORF6N domain-containing protein [Flavobacteriales bacterium]|nr:ORF6N domain-containing protein [Flavobacteriales bacterium]